jgi:stearoyl-CoA desaturase (delta-9 desaturase)
MWNRYRADPFFLIRYSVGSIVLCALIIRLHATIPGVAAIHWGWFAAAALLVLPNFYLQAVAALGFSAVCFGLDTPANRLLLPPLAVSGLFLGCYAAVAIHTASHQAFRPRWVNRIVGEVCGVLLLTGYATFLIPHLAHHRYPDDPLRDPHPPGHLSFPAYLNGMVPTLVACMNRLYADLWAGRDGRYPWLSRITRTLIPLAFLMRVLLLLVLLRPMLFAYLFVPLYIAELMLFAHVNYMTHRPDPAGGFMILDLKDGIFHRVMNAVFLGTYCHRTHHLRPYLLNPSRAAPDDRPMRTYGQVITSRSTNG